MTPVRRLASALIVLAAGALLALIGAVTRWYTVAWPGRSIDVPEFGRVRFPGTTIDATGGDLSRVVTGTAVALFFVALLATLAGKRTRAPLLVLSVAGAAVLAGWALTTGGDAAVRYAPASLDELGEPVVSAGPGRWLTVIGALLAAAAAAWGAPVARRVDRLRLPEGAPQNGTQGEGESHEPGHEEA